MNIHIARRKQWEEAELAKLKAKGKVPTDDRWKERYAEPEPLNAAALSALPPGWCWASIEELALIESGQTPDGLADHRPKGERHVPWFRVGDMNHPHNTVTMRFAEVWLSSDEVRRFGLHVRPAGTIVFPKRGGAIATNKKRLLTQVSTFDLNTMGIVAVGAVQQYVWSWFQSVDLGSLNNGSTVPQINYGDIAPLPVPLPPINEQRRIVTKLDAVFEQTRAAKARLERLPALLEKLKRSILAAAFRGDLTKDWRAAHPDVEPASVLLDRIRNERHRRWEDGLRAKGKDPKKSIYEEPVAIDLLPAPDLPSGWTWGSVDEVVANHDSKRIPVKVEDRRGRSGEYPYYGAFGIIDYVDAYLFDGERVLLAEDGKNLLERARPISLVATGRYWVNNHAHVLEVLGGMPAFYLSSYFNTVDLRDRLTGIDQVKLTRGAMDSLPLPIAPLEEQRVIVERLETSLANIDRQLAAIQNSIERAGTLERAALAKAFRGELVPQDPTDEPASVLLDRVARAAEPGRPRRGRGPRRDDAVAKAASNGHATNGHHDESLDLVVGMFQIDQRLTATAITEATGLQTSAVKRALKILVDAGQLRVQGRARSAIYEWTR